MPSDLRDIRLEQADRNDWSAHAGPEWSQPEEHWRHLLEASNMVEAVDAIAWETILPTGATVLDLGCGTGWLTAKLSARPEVERVIAWDSSRPLLEELFPAVVELVGGRPDKIERVCGDFLPLLLDDGAVSVAVMSSAFHHSPDPQRLLGELVRVVEPTGPVLLVNETPWSRARMASFAARIALRVGADAARGSGRPARGPSVGFDHALYDVELGDRAYTLAQWQAMFAAADLEPTVIDSGLPPYKAAFRPRAHLEANLTHFLLHRRPAVGR